MPNSDEENRRLSRFREAAEQQEREALEAELQFAKKKAAEDLECKLSDDINTLEQLEKKQTISCDSKNKLAELKQQKLILANKIDFSVNSQKPFLENRQKIRSLQMEITKKRSERNDKRKSFLNNFVSFIGTTLLAVSAFVVTAAIVSNPVGIAIAGVALLGVTTMIAIKDKIFPKKEKTLQPLDKKSISIPKPPQENFQEHPHEHLEDTERIVHQLAHGSAQREKDILKSDIEHYHIADKLCNCRLKKPKTNLADAPRVANEEEPKEKNDRNRFDFGKH